MMKEKLQKKVPVIAAFDFDGTITYCDTLIPFLLSFTSIWKTSFKLILLIPTFLSFLLGKKSREEVKEAILTRFVKGVPSQHLEQIGSNFALKRLNRFVKPSALDRIQWHRQQGHRCILVSASIDVYLEPWAKQIGFTNVLTSRLEIDSQTRATGRLNGLNCRGPEKIRRLEELLGTPKNYTLYAYGDSLGDRELLAFADYTFYREIPKEKLYD
jgi:HAD superfamily hydrolase (TIGR01490 family)